MVASKLRKLWGSIGVPVKVRGPQGIDHTGRQTTGNQLTGGENDIWELFLFPTAENKSRKSSLGNRKERF